MAVKIRLSRIGKKKAPCYRIVAVDSRKKRDGQYLDNLGTYEALTGKFVQIKQDRIDYWISQGAQLSDSAKKLLKLSKKGPQALEKKVKAKPVKKAQEVKSEPAQAEKVAEEKAASVEAKEKELVTPELSVKSKESKEAEEKAPESEVKAES